MGCCAMTATAGECAWSVRAGPTAVAAAATGDVCAPRTTRGRADVWNAAGRAFSPPRRHRGSGGSTDCPIPTVVTPCGRCRLRAVTTPTPTRSSASANGLAGAGSSAASGATSLPRPTITSSPGSSAPARDAPHSAPTRSPSPCGGLSPLRIRRHLRQARAVDGRPKYRAVPESGGAAFRPRDRETCLAVLSSCAPVLRDIAGADFGRQVATTLSVVHRWRP